MNFLDDPSTLAAPRLLCVDDEPNIIQALKRAFRPSGCEVFTALSGEQGLRILSEQAIDVVISDMRMPEMDGAQFLEAARRRFPMTSRVLLTGQSDLSSTIAAINRGEIHRYIAKPWDDEDLLLTIAQVIERRRLEELNRRLEELALAQNESLRLLNADLEGQVARQTEALRRSVDSLTQANRQLDDSLFTSVRVFAGMIEMQSTGRGQHARQVARLCRQMAERARFAAAPQRDLFLAGLLHEIGAVGLPDHLFERTPSSLSDEDQIRLRSHPVRGASLLMSVPALKGAADLIRAHHENHDGSGYPLGLKGEQIPFAAMLLHAASAYDNALRHQLRSEPLKAPSSAAALASLRQEAGRRFHPRALDLLEATVGSIRPGDDSDLMSPADQAPQPVRSSRSVTSMALRAGMILSDDLFSSEGALLLAAEHQVDDETIRHLRDFELIDGQRLKIRVLDDETVAV